MHSSSIYRPARASTPMRPQVSTHGLTSPDVSPQHSRRPENANSAQAGHLAPKKERFCLQRAAMEIYIRDCKHVESARIAEKGRACPQAPASHLGHRVSCPSSKHLCAYQQKRALQTTAYLGKIVEGTAPHQKRAGGCCKCQKPSIESKGLHVCDAAMLNRHHPPRYWHSVQETSVEDAVRLETLRLAVKHPACPWQQAGPPSTQPGRPRPLPSATAHLLCSSKLTGSGPFKPAAMTLKRWQASGVIPSFKLM